jgi:hypothetical protein
MRDSFREYKISPRNSTVCGYPGRGFDWSKFSWNREGIYDFGDARYSTECADEKVRGKLIGKRKAPAVFVDNGFIGEGSQYLHVPYDWAEAATVYRVRPNESMQAGSTWRGHKVIRQTAVKKHDGWYWRLRLAPNPNRV